MKKATSKFSVKALMAAFAALVMLLSFALAITPTKSAYAGLTNTYFLESAGFNGALSKGTFNYDSSDDIKIDGDNVIYFGSTANNEKTSAKLAVLAKLNRLTELGSDFVTANMTLDVTDIPAGGAFVYAMGLPSRNSAFGTAGAVEFRVVKASSGYALKVVKNTDSGTTVIAENLAIDSSVDLSIDINADTSVSITADGSTILSSAQIGYLPTGYVAFGFTGAKCNVAISKIMISLSDYHTPENPGTIKENFSNNEFNANIWWSEAKTGVASPSFAHVENSYLRISNAHKPHFTSLYQYSNLSLEFDLFDYGCYQEDEDGNVISYTSETFTVFLGCSSYNEDIYTSIRSNTNTRINIGVIEGSAGRDVTSVSNIVSVSNAGTSVKATMTDVNPCDATLTNGRRTRVKIEVVDLNLKLYLKYSDQSSFGQPIIETTLRTQPTGYVRFGCYGDNQLDANGWERTLVPNFSIDTIELKNLDAEPNICAMPEFKSNVYDMGDDWPYVDTDRNTDLLGNRLDQSVVNNGEDGGCGGSVVGTAMVTIPAVVGAVTLTCIRRKKRNEEK